MFEVIAYIALGAFLGWNFPQPQYAKNIQAKIISLFKNTAG